MAKKKGYIVLEVGYEYNDEYYSTEGDRYEAPKKVFVDKEKATVELNKKLFERLRGEDLGRYNGDGLRGVCKKGMEDDFCRIFKEEFDMDISDEDYEYEIPKKATDEQLAKILECLDLDFFELVEVELD